ncbi:unnamed protein product [Medioppia subpectinata]|uniref:BPTI/Kunitz inhibitor domain-containing protein n=1 Tax=Medioppia subpectinata TaxID=1979941 RepID=A0A7R9KDQ7_9ACAR|nr:unnamed protein product [Medioppia subpectinata]CAG2101566.1 unnamed protein product [Medioppia subpectinata]
MIASNPLTSTLSSGDHYEHPVIETCGFASLTFFGGILLGIVLTIWQLVHQLVNPTNRPRSAREVAEARIGLKKPPVVFRAIHVRKQFVNIMISEFETHSVQNRHLKCGLTSGHMKSSTGPQGQASASSNTSANQMHMTQLLAKFQSYKLTMSVASLTAFKNYASNCKQRKPYAFCGAKTVVGTQWYYDLRKDKCMPFKYCLNAEEIDIKRTSLENRFTSELQCEYLCHKKKHIKTSKTMTDKLNQMLLKRLKKTISVHYQQRNSLQVQSFSQFEMKDPSRCKRQKSYSFCGSHTTPHVHWYYNKRLNRCQPYTFCEVVDYKPLNPYHKAPDGGFGWIIVFASFMISFIGDGYAYTTGLFYAQFLVEYKESESVTSLFDSIMTGMMYCSGPVASGLTATFGCRTGLGLLYLPQVMIITYWFDDHLALATGIGVCGSGLGISVFALLSEHLIVTYGWKGAMLLLSGLMFTCIAFSAFFRKVDYMEEKSDLKSALKETFNFNILKDMVFLYYGFASFLNGTVFYVPIIFLKDHVVKTGMGTGADAVNLMVIFGFCNAFGRVFFGYIADFQSLNRILLYGLSIITYGIAIGLIAAFSIDNYKIMVFGIIVFGMAKGAFITLMSVVIVDLFGMEKVTNVLGVVNLIFGQVFAQLRRGDSYGRSTAVDFCGPIVSTCLQCNKE